MALSFEVWRVPERPVQHDQRDWWAGVRLDPDARRALAYRMRISSAGMSRVGVRELSGASSSPGQVRYPGSMNMEASRGYATTGYQTAELSFGNCDAQRSLLSLAEDRATRRHGGDKKALNRGAKVGFCPFAPFSLMLRRLHPAVGVHPIL